ncbi:major facilitator superfamily domain-containing protein [Stachybotrys elegans]|uniref:Major facilitator superfamily domain-containing protein n=1 Tax=Stachybotrys elegans TaxID=80388 RepID=A0A8K0WVZ7_9HYPO|nr:major facilitator superfamily domain-containing protein [Stachybotrys elegans]
MAAAKATDGLAGSSVRELRQDAESSPLLGAGADGDESPQDSVRVQWNGMEDFEGLPWWRKPSVFWLLGPYLVFTLAFGGIIVPKLNLIRDLICDQYFADKIHVDPTFGVQPVLLGSDNPQCRIPEVQKIAAMFFLVMNLCTGLLSAIVIPKLGHLSDMYGRRRLMAFASCGGLTGEIITILAAKFPDVVDYRWLVLGSILDGLTGSFTAGSILCQSYTSDCTPPSKRAVSMGYINACLFGGLAFGPMLAAYFINWTHSLLSIFYVALGCHISFIIFVGFVIPDSLSKRQRQSSLEKWEKLQESQPAARGSWLSTLLHANPFAPLKAFWPTGPGTSLRLRLNLVALAVIDAAVMGTAMAAGQVIILYAGYAFNWGNFDMSRFVSATCLVRVAVLMGVFPVVNYFGRTLPARRRAALGLAPRDLDGGADSMDIWVLRVALMFEVTGSIGYILGRTGLVFALSGMTASVGALGSATIQAVITKHVPSGQVGRTLGAMGFMHAIGRVVSPIFFNSLYAATVDKFPQAIFVLLGSLFVGSLLASFVIKPHVYWETVAEEAEPEQEPLVSGSEGLDPEVSARTLQEDQFLIGPSQ